MKELRKYFFSQKLKNIPKDKIPEYLHTTVFNGDQFALHIQRAAFSLKIDEVIVRNVVESFFINVMVVINTTRKIKTKINVYGFFSLIVEKGNRI